MDNKSCEPTPQRLFQPIEGFQSIRPSVDHLDMVLVQGDRLARVLNGEVKLGGLHVHVTFLPNQHMTVSADSELTSTTVAIIYGFLCGRNIDCTSVELCSLLKVLLLVVVVSPFLQCGGELLSLL